MKPTPLPSAARALILSRPSRDANLVPAACILVNATGGGGAGKLAKHGPDPLQRYAASARLAVVDPIRHQQPLTGKASRRRCAGAVMRLAHLAIDDGHAGDELNALAVAAVMRRAQAKLWRGRQRGKRGAWCERVEEMAVPEAKGEWLPPAQLGVRPPAALRPTPRLALPISLLSPSEIAELPGRRPVLPPLEHLAIERAFASVQMAHSQIGLAQLAARAASCDSHEVGSE